MATDSGIVASADAASRLEEVRARVLAAECPWGQPVPAEGSPAARLALDNIKHVEVLEYPELGMEAVWKIDVEDFPAFIVVDDKGNDFFAETQKPIALTVRTRSAEKV